MIENYKKPIHPRMGFSTQYKTLKFNNKYKDGC